MPKSTLNDAPGALEQELGAAYDALEVVLQRLGAAARLAGDSLTRARLRGVGTTVRLSAVYLGFAAHDAGDRAIAPPFGSPDREAIARGLFGARSDSDARLVILESLDWFSRNPEVYPRDVTLLQLTFLFNCFSGRRLKNDDALSAAVERALVAWVSVANGSKGSNTSKWAPTNAALALVGLECASSDALNQVWAERHKIISRKRKPRSSKLAP